MFYWLIASLALDQSAAVLFYSVRACGGASLNSSLPHSMMTSTDGALATVDPKSSPNPCHSLKDSAFPVPFTLHSNVALYPVGM